MSQADAPSLPVLRALRAIAQAEVVLEEGRSAVIHEMAERETLRREHAQTERARVERHLKHAQRNLQRARDALADRDLGILLPVPHAPETPDLAGTEERSLEGIAAASDVEACRVEAGVALLKVVRRRHRLNNLPSSALASRGLFKTPRPLVDADNRLILAWRMLAADDLEDVARVKEIVRESLELLDAASKELGEAYSAERAELERAERVTREGSLRFGLLFAILSAVTLWVVLLPATTWILDLGSPYSKERVARLAFFTIVVSVLWGAALAAFFRTLRLRRITERIAQVDQGISILKGAWSAPPLVSSGIRLFSRRAFRRTVAVGFGVGIVLTIAPMSLWMSGATTCDVEGVWELVEMRVDGVDVSTRWQSRKVLTDGKWELASTPTASGVESGEAQILRGAGSYSVNGDIYVEHVTQFHDPRMVGDSNTFTCQIIGDHWYSEGTLRYLSDASRSYNLYEVWRRGEEQPGHRESRNGGGNQAREHGVHSLGRIVEDTRPLAPSFDCAEAELVAERIICQDEELSRLDEQMAADYRSALVRTADASLVRADQRRWLTERNRCASRDCLTSMYRRRIADLRRY